MRRGRGGAAVPLGGKLIIKPSQCLQAAVVCALGARLGGSLASPGLRWDGPRRWKELAPFGSALRGGGWQRDGPPQRALRGTWGLGGQRARRLGTPGAGWGQDRGGDLGAAPRARAFGACPAVSASAGGQRAGSESRRAGCGRRLAPLSACPPLAFGGLGSLLAASLGAPLPAWLCQSCRGHVPGRAVGASLCHSSASACGDRSSAGTLSSTSLFLSFGSWGQPLQQAGCRVLGSWR